MLGYPIVKKVRSKIIELFPIPELLSYETYISQIGNNDQKLNCYFNTFFKSANNEYYNYWVPIYIDKYHFEKNKTNILNSFSIIKYGVLGKKEYDFKPEQIFEILPIILNKMIIGMLLNLKKCSHSFIQSYFHYILLLKKLIEIYKNEFNEYINYYINKIISNGYSLDKTLIPDIGNFIILLFFSDLEISQKLWDCLYKEILIRQMFWMLGNNFIKEDINKIEELTEKDELMKEIKTNIDELFLDKFKNPTNFNMRHRKKFIEDCKRNLIYSDIVNLLSQDKKVIYQNSVEFQFKKCFKNLYISACDETKQKIDNLILQHLSFQKYFKYHMNYDDIDIKFYYVSEIKIKNLKEKLKNNLILYNLKGKNKEFFKKCYTSQKGNSLILVSIMANKKIKEKGFLEKLENNYGVFLEADKFINEIKNKINEIKNYYDLYKYIGCTLLQSDDLNDEIKLIADAYNAAVNKGYINI